MSLELFENPVNAPVQFVESFPQNIKLYIKREDLIHPQISGNKWRKLKYNLIKAHQKGCQSVLTFGGAFSNHIYATAAAGAACSIKTVGVIRGEINESLNPTLRKASDWGMELVPISRKQYKDKMNPRFLSCLKSRFGDFYLIPEGGTNALALKGCAEMTAVPEKFDYWCVSCGTGGTMAGLLTGLNASETVLGFPALKGGEFLEKEINILLKKAGTKARISWKLCAGYHFGGYAQITRSLIIFIQNFKENYKIDLDPVYTGKMLFGVVDLIKKGYFAPDSRILALHTGGLQGIAGIEEKYGIKIN